MTKTTTTRTNADGGSVQMATTDLSTGSYDAEQIRLMEEVCILLDRDDYPQGSASKKDCHLMTNIRQGLLHRAFSLFLFDGEGKLLLQQRASEKITFPDMWTNTCCSHPLHISGEVESVSGDFKAAVLGAKRAAQRKVLQELGIAPEEAPIEEMHYLTRIHYLAASENTRPAAASEGGAAAEGEQGDAVWGEHEIDYILILRTPGNGPKLDVNPNEVRDTRWVSQSDLKAMFADEKDLSYTPWFKLICNTFLFKWWDTLDSLHTVADPDTIHRLGF